MSFPQHQVGHFYWNAWHDDATGKVEIDEYGLRSIRQNTAYFTLKSNGVTWGKRSKTHGDFGWLDPVPRWTRTPVRIGGEQIRRFAKTKAAALRAAIAAERKTRQFYKGKAVIEAECDCAIAALQARLKRARS